MSMREKLKQRKEKRSQAANEGLNGNLPEGVSRYVRLGKELKDGKTFVLLADPDHWYGYFTHEDGDYAKRATYLRKHTCLHSPKSTAEVEDIAAFERPDKNKCISCAAKAKRRLYNMIPVFDPQYSEWRVLDVKEYHALNLLEDCEKLEKAARKFKEDYKLVGDAVVISKTSDGKSYTISSGEVDDKVLAEAKKMLDIPIPYTDLVNFRSEEDMMKLLQEATPEAGLDRSVFETVLNDDAGLPF